MKTEDLTDDQYDRILEVATRTDPPQDAHELIEATQPTIGCDGAVATPWCRMMLCIEKDGYCHT